jgi:hypothetical protein
MDDNLSGERLSPHHSSISIMKSFSPTADDVVKHFSALRAAASICLFPLGARLDMGIVGKFIELRQHYGIVGWEAEDDLLKLPTYFLPRGVRTNYRASGRSSRA